MWKSYTSSHLLKNGSGAQGVLTSCRLYGDSRMDTTFPMSCNEIISLMATSLLAFDMFFTNRWSLLSCHGIIAVYR